MIQWSHERKISMGEMELHVSHGSSVYHEHMNIKENEPGFFNISPTYEYKRKHETKISNLVGSQYSSKPTSHQTSLILLHEHFC